MMILKYFDFMNSFGSEPLFDIAEKSSDEIFYLDRELSFIREFQAGFPVYNLQRWTEQLFYKNIH